MKNSSYEIKLFCDRYIFIKQNNGGIKTYFKNILNKIDKKIIARNYINDRDDKNLFNSFFEILKSYFEPLYKNLLQRKNSKNVYHGSYYLNPLLPLYKFPKVITIHDMIPELFPTHLEKSSEKALNLIRRARKFSIDNCDQIITPSLTTKNDLLSIYPYLKRERVSVIHHGIDHFSNKNVYPEIVDEYLDKEFLLYVGSRAHYKGFFDLVKAYAVVVKEYPNLKLICAGIKFNRNEMIFFRENNIDTSKIINVQPNNNQLKFLYCSSSAFIYPSLYEGFGFPPLEAIISGAKSVICSSIPSTKEICMEYVEYYPAGDVDSLVSFIFKALLYRKSIDSEIQKIILKKYSWQKSAKKHLELYYELCNNCVVQ
tara:strand:- start:1879 stop:2988 length:1110 start_codon:yes stop_codon:yes gene_type:complete